MIKSIPFSITPDMKKTFWLWSFPVLAIILTYNNFTNNKQLMFKMSDVQQVSAPKKQKKSRQYKVLSVNGLHTFNASNINLVKSEFKKYNYDLSSNKAPRIQPNKIPSDFNKITDVRLKKETFIKLMLPLAIDINNHMLSKQKLLNQIIADYNKNNQLSKQRLIQLKQLGLEFSVKIRVNKLNEVFKSLQQKIHIIPVSLVLSQAIVESGWGTSRFAILGNALFGQWTYNSKSDLIPINRDSGKTHSIKTFSSPYQSMKAYMINLNRNRAYKKLRDIRLRFVNSNQKISSIALADGLINYSQEREVYVNKIKSIIKNNNLQKYDNYTLTK